MPDESTDADLAVVGVEVGLEREQGRQRGAPSFVIRMT
jgi:hypothetical protein